MTQDVEDRFCECGHYYEDHIWSHSLQAEKCWVESCRCLVFRDKNDYLPANSYTPMTKERMDEIDMKDAVRRWELFFDVPHAWPDESHFDRVRLELKGGHKINAIRYVRLVSDMGLKEAKDWVDAFQKAEGL